MFLNFIKKQSLTLLLLTLFIIPNTILAYSEFIIASGKSVGMKLNTAGIIVVGSYEINGHNSLIESGLKTGDIIYQINSNEVNSIDDMVNIIENCNCKNLKINYKRLSKNNSTVLNLYEDKGVMKTGLYVKDTITGVGTLTFIDPNTKLFGVLGHEITDINTGKLIDIETGSIFDSSITSITKSDRGDPGEKNAVLYSDKVEGIIKENTTKGIFGQYSLDINDDKLYKVATIDDVKIGKAKIKTVLENNKVEEFDINILSVKETKDKLKNIQLEITDKKLLEQSNGIVQGMSGSPIIQDEYIIGAVTHVVVENPHKGYGILIENMLEEAEN